MPNHPDSLEGSVDAEAVFSELKRETKTMLKQVKRNKFSSIPPLSGRTEETLLRL